LECQCYNEQRHSRCLVYYTTFSKDKATETFTWRIRNGKPALLGYNINSPALLRAMVDDKSTDEKSMAEKN